MDVTTKCPKCGLMLALDVSLADEFECPQCGQRLTVRQPAAKGAPHRRHPPPRRTASSGPQTVGPADDIDWSVPELPQRYQKRRRRRGLELDPAVVWSLVIVAACILALTVGGIAMSRRRGAEIAEAGKNDPRAAATKPAPAPTQPAPPPAAAQTPPVQPPGPEKPAPPAFVGWIADQAQQAQDDLAGKFGRQRTVMVVGNGFTGTEHQALSDQLGELVKRMQVGERGAGYSGSHSGQWSALVFAPLDDLDAFARAIDFATVTHVAPDQRRVYVTPKK